MLPSVLAFCALVSLAFVTDLATMRIPNQIPAVLVGVFVVSALVSGMEASAIAAHFAAALAMLLVTFALFALGTMGGGDAKLIAAIALWFGPVPAIADFLLLMALLGGALTVALVGARALRPAATGVAFVDRLLDRKVGVPYAVAIAPAAVLTFPYAAWLAA